MDIIFYKNETNYLEVNWRYQKIMKKVKGNIMFWILLALIAFWILIIALLRQYTIFLVIFNTIAIFLIAKPTPLFKPNKFKKIQK